MESQDFSRWFGSSVRLIDVEERSNASDAFLAERRELWWKPVPEGCGESILDPIDPDVLATADVSTAGVVQAAYRFRFGKPGLPKTLQEQLAQQNAQNHRVVNAVRMPDGSGALVGMTMAFHLRGALEFRRDVTLYTYLEPVSEDILHQVLNAYRSAVFAVRERIAQRDRLARSAAFFATIDPETARGWAIPKLCSEEGNAGIAAYRDQRNGTARGMGPSELRWNDANTLGTSLLEPEFRGATQKDDKAAVCVHRATSRVPGVPEKTSNDLVTDVIRLKDGTHAVRMYARLNETYWSGGGDKGYDWTERDMLVPVPEAVALAVAEAVRAGLIEAAADRKTEQNQENLLTTMRRHLASRRLDKDAVAAARNAALAREKLDPASVEAAQRDALLAKGFAEADIRLLLGRPTS